MFTFLYTPSRLTGLWAPFKFIFSFSIDYSRKYSNTVIHLDHNLKFHVQVEKVLVVNYIYYHVYIQYTYIFGKYKIYLYEL